MNNGKVRIYELSRELNLDNRDILAVCEQLNIPVKSHSSTITETEAARIRDAAEKYVPSHSSSSKPTQSSHAASTQSRQSKTQPPVKKQQILEIRRNRTVAEPPKRPEMEATPPQPAPPAPSAQHTGQSGQPSQSARPVRLNAPSRVGQPDVSSDIAATVEAPEMPSNLVDPEQTEYLIDHSTEPTAEELQGSPELEMAETAVDEDDSSELELVSPPVRPVSPKPPDSAQFSPPVSRPILRRPKTGSDEPQGGGNGARSPERAPAEPVEMRVRPVRNDDSSPRREEVSLKPKPSIELRHKPVRPGARTSTDEVDTASRSTSPEPPVPGGEGVELRRPILPRVPKRTKDWEEEEDDQEALQKAKAPAKAKRRAQPVIDDDEDLVESLGEIDLEDDSDDDDREPTPVQVSLSLARPAKPKNRMPQSKPASTPAAPKRGGRSGSSGESSRGFRRDRRQEETKQRPEELTLTGSLTVHDLAEALAVQETEIIKTLFFKGIAANINQILDIPTAAMVSEEFGVEVKTGQAEAEAKKITEMLDEEDVGHLQYRPPVVTIMGHVDHGKTTLLDSIRKTKVAQGEAGGITQHIGAYHVDVDHDDETRQVVFLDTPGHEAFTAMRARGARVTDIAILVVAADDGVRPQTIEAISHAKAAEVPIIVAINKIDKEGAQPERVKQELTEHGLLSEEWGGDTIMVPVSAINGDNLDTLLEMILLVAEVEDLHANPDRRAKGTVIEAHLDKARGPVATLLIQNGTLRVGDVLVAGSAFGKVRAMVDDRGKRVEIASPSFAVEVLGLNDVPAAGDDFEVYPEEKEARLLATGRNEQQRQSRLQQQMASRRVSLNTISAQAQEGELKELNLILKADVQGSVEAILGSLQRLPQNEVQVRVLLAAPGEVTETDVDLAAASNAVIIGFNTTLASGSRQAADAAGVDVRDYDIIYKLLEDIQGAMEGLLEPEMVEEPLGEVEVRAIFPLNKGAVAGCYVLSGKAIRDCRLRVRRGKDIVHEGGLDSLKRVKENVKEVNAGYECGIRLDNFSNWQIGDIIETYRLATKRRTLSA
ncbi:translation initiation factor IF-2 [Oculatella sp. LEGE 06141]|uniref:translation initiation factor IF-2 n=1 Tax=Oculatella sp. LEGE 06141 TaxID=1828648 RepID=UPI0018823E7C|nr:translation initiation factor IF-2 [Oculatella sp. LEGE 06141]MBE9177663.1 translation initiation factor IF-2 [Oculatella sp. LEGE 06141]